MSTAYEDGDGFALGHERTAGPGATNIVTFSPEAGGTLFQE